jgi:hypothetical protein
LKKGSRGLSGGSSLSKLLGKKFDLTEKWILEKAEEYKRKHGRWPSAALGKIEGTDERWSRIDAALIHGYRGLLGGSSLSKLLGREKDDLTVEWILKKSEKYRRRHGHYPNQKSGVIEGSDETWMGIDSALRDGYRGLPGGSSLSKLLRSVT